MPNSPKHKKKFISETKAFYHELIEYSQDLIWQCDIEGRYVYLNPAWEDTFGYSLTEMLGKKFTDFQAPEMATRDLKKFKEITDGSIIKNYETIHLNKKGQPVYLIFNSAPVFNKEGKICGTRGTAYDITEQKRIEEQFELIKRAVDSHYDEAYWIDQNNNYIYINKATCQNTGYLQSEIIGKKVDLLNPNATQERMEEIWQYHRKNGYQRFRSEHHRKDGSTYPVEIVTKYIKFKDREYICGFARDMRETDKAEQILKLSEQRYKTITDLISDYIFEVGVDEKGFITLLSTSDNLFRLTGRSIEDARTFEDWKSIFHPEDLQIAISALKKILTDGQPLRFECRSLRKTGGLRWIQINAKGLTDNTNNKVYKIIGCIKDITGIKIEEEKRKESELFLKKAQSIAKIGHFKFNPSKNEIEGSDEFYNIFGLSKEQFKTSDFVNLIHPDYKKLVINTLNTAIQNKTNFEVEYYIFLPDGISKYVKSIGEITTGNDDKTNLVIGTIQDITDRKKMEDEKIKLEQGIQKTQKLESLGILAGGLAHDFNNLLGGIFGYIELALKSSKDERSIGFLKKSLNTINRARGLTQQLLTFAKGGAPVKKISYLFPFIQESVQFILSGSNITTHFDIASDLKACNFDQNQIAQVIENIIINAQQAMPLGGSIEISAENIYLRNQDNPAMQGGEYIRISIKDSGIGIPQDILHYIFDPFFTTKQEGRGLGLSSAYSIITRHNGYIDVISEAGKGATFHIYLPSVSTSTESITPEYSVNHEGTGNILIMDDEQVIRETLAETIKDLGYSPILKESGNDVIEFITKESEVINKLNAIILDLTIPGGMGGQETVGIIRNMGISIPIFVTSGYANDPIMAEPGKFGFDGCINKPFTKKEIAILFNKHLSYNKNGTGTT
jgi:two-component system, cell cycle sensor histidine kinase and response regulator CckA